MKQLILDTNVIKDLLRDITEACTDNKMHLADKKKIQKEVDQSWLIFFSFYVNNTDQRNHHINLQAKKLYLPKS